MERHRWFVLFDFGLIFVLTAAMAASYSGLLEADLSYVILAVAAALGTLFVLVNAFISLKAGKLSVDLLAATALIASLASKEMAAAAFINLMLASARIFSRYTEGRAKAAIQSLMKLRPEKVRLQQPGGIILVPIERVREGDIVVAEAGDRIPIDGTIVEGEANIDQSSLTGESVPIAKSKGDKVYSATFNVSGSLIIRAEKVGKDTTLQKIINLVESSQKEKSEIRTTAERFTAWYIAVVIVGSVLIYAISHNFPLVLSLLLVVCADDIAIAIPVTFLGSIGYAARRGVIIKGGKFLEAISETKTVIVDKTGTLTKGKLKVYRVEFFGRYKEKEFLLLASASESLSSHPVSKAVLNYAESKGVKPERPDKFHEIPGRGTRAVYHGKLLCSGKVSFIEEMGFLLSDKEKVKINEAEESGLSITVFGYNGKVAGFVAYADEIRPSVASAFKKLKNLGVESIVMLTGDNEKAAGMIAKQAGISDYRANLTPAEKVESIKKRIRKGSRVVMIGDGVNDAAALAVADIGIAMGAIGSDAAIEAADIALMHDNFSLIPEMIKLGRWTMKVVKQDFIIWGIVNVVGITLVFAGALGPRGASAYNFLTDFLPFFNSLKIFGLSKKLNV